MKNPIVIDAPMWNVCDRMGLHPLNDSQAFLSMIYDSIICKCGSSRMVPLESIVDTPLEHAVLDSIGDNANITLEINRWTRWQSITASTQVSLGTPIRGIFKHSTH